MFTKRYSKTVDWSETYRAGSLGEWRSLYEVRAAFDFLLVIVLLGFLIAAILIRKRGMKRGIVLFVPLVMSLIAYTLSNFFSAIIDCIYLTDATVKLAIELVFILEDFTDLFALCTIMYLLYWIINHFQMRSTGRVSDGLHLFHGIIFGLLGVICVVELALYIGYTVTTYEYSKWSVPWHWVQCTRRLAFFVASLEIVIWAFCLVVRTSRNDRQAKPTALVFLLASFGFFAMNVMWAIITIQWDIIVYLGYIRTHPRWIYYFQIVFPYLCMVVIYLGMLLSCKQLASLEGVDGFDIQTPRVYPTTTYQNPYTNSLDVESRPMVRDPSQELLGAGSRPIHEAGVDHRFRL
ncbi:uncharacterized protein N7496_000644 [Penicillium cataractarum]|uniref:Uncharacterized protein n=1 Tax=Penicillium cataractarum TaxID=2100454 RepID=A0A9W9VUF8_9EURO|nr:uncharacterized protein N7496_000644 [Penicillium cataractarum]KAJ5389576.1 hypothetical protein N7496_000644 [Penicillium cataractarum]